MFNSTDEGVSWSAINPVPGTNVLVYDAVSPSDGVIYAAASNGNVYKTQDYGANWSAAVDVGTVARSVAVNPAYSSVVYAAGDSGLWKYNGTSWSQIGSPTITNVVKVMMHPSYQGSSNYVWVVSSGGSKVYKTTNGGANSTDWTEISGVPTTTIITTLGDDGVNKGYSYLGTADGAYRINELPAAPASFTGTNVGGVPNLTWSANIESDLLSSPYRVVRYDLTCTGYCPNKQCSIVSGSLDSLPGAWTSNTYHNDTQTTVANCGMAGLLPGMVGYYAVVRDNLGQFSGPSATKEFNKGEGNIEKPHIPGEIPAETPRDFQLFENFPNPFNPVTTIRYNLPANVHVRLAVFDALGQEVAILVDGRETAGYKAVSFDASNLASGVYLYKLTASSFTDVKKMIVTK